MKRTRRNHSVVYKAKVALAALKGDKTLVELSQQFDVHANEITQWKSQLLARASDVFATGAERTESAGPSFKELHAKPVLSIRAIGRRPLDGKSRSQSDRRSGKKIR